MNALNELFTKTLGWTTAPDFIGLFIIVAVALLVILLITIIVSAVKGKKKNARIKTLEQENANNREYAESVRAGNEDVYADGNSTDVEAIKAQAKAELEAELREQLAAEYAAGPASDGAEAVDTEAIKEQAKAELEPQLRAQIEAEMRDGIEAQVRAEYAEMFAGQDAGANDGAQTAELMRQADEYKAQAAALKTEIDDLQNKTDAQQKQIDELDATIAEKNKRIDELGELLMQAGSDHKSDNGELYVQINTLNKDNTELNKQINALKAENARLKSEKDAAAATTTAAKAPAKSTTTKTAAAKSTAKATPDVKIVRNSKATKTAEPASANDDGEEVYNDYGDATSAVKVTLKYDPTKANWAIYRSDTARVYRRIVTKQEALVIAKDLAKRLHAQLLVYTKDGKSQKL